MNKVTLEYQNWYDVDVECSTANVKVEVDTQQAVVDVQAFIKGDRGDQGVAGTSSIPLNGIVLDASASSQGFEPIVVKTNNIQNQGYPDWKENIIRFDNVNLPDTSPNMVYKMGFNPGITPPVGQVSLEDAWEYKFNVNNQNPAVLVVERHVGEFRPITGTTQRFATWAANWNGAKTEYDFVGDISINKRANGTNAVVWDHLNFNDKTQLTIAKALVINSPLTTIENNLKISGLGNIFNDNGNELNFGSSTNNNIVTFYGSTISNGTIFRIKNNNSPTGWGIKINSFPALQFIDETTGNVALGLFNGAPSNSIIVRASGHIGFGVSGPVHPIQHSNGAHLTAAGAWVNASDLSYKDKIKPSKYGLYEILKLNPVEYIHKTSGLKQVGLIAQELEKIMPEFVTGEEGNKGINYGQIVSVLINAIKQLNDRN